MDICGIDTSLNDIYLANTAKTGINCTDTLQRIPTEAERITVIFIFTVTGLTGIVFNSISIWVVLRGKNTSKAIRGTKLQLVNQSAGQLMARFGSFM